MIDVKDLKKSIITIDQQIGGDGEGIAIELAELLNAPFFGADDLLSEAARESGIEKRVLEKYAETRLLAAYDFTADDYDKIKFPPAGRLIAAKSAAALALAQNGPCVIAGGHASIAFKDKKNVVRVFVHADAETRIQSLPEYTDMNPDAAVEKLMKADLKRTAYYRKLNSEWGTAPFYQLVFDTVGLSHKKSALRIFNFFFDSDTLAGLQEKSA
ncbi:MAG: cytidylate kinase-like family protein [Synergistaceae bacterium]|jgi:cytidylate kinase|nr:cytidylate kinase-like family protein [Synergistaceae bacterium]